MRSEQTDAERKLWLILRDRKLAGFKFRRQHPIAGYIVDFFCMKKKLVIEADGAQHYDDAEGTRYDERRTGVLAKLGIRVVRFSDYDILKFPDAVARSIYRELTEPSPLPSPGVPGEGGRFPADR